ncbi:MAG: hypothetical protein IPQ09_19565 [Myxococcales bacterium]|nr:hypothetical protein [Myxococcales bacterium]
MRLATSIVLFAVFSTFCQRARAEETPAPTPRAPSRPPAAAVDKLPPRPNSVEGYDETLERMRAALATAPATRAVRLSADVKVVEQWYREDVQTGSTGAIGGRRRGHSHDGRRRGGGRVAAGRARPVARGAAPGCGGPRRPRSS